MGSGDLVTDTFSRSLYTTQRETETMSKQMTPEQREHEMAVTKPLAAFLRAECDRKGIRPEALQRKTGWNTRQWSGRYQGLYPWKISDLAAAAAALGMEPQEFYAAAEDKRKVTPRSNDWFFPYFGLTSEDIPDSMQMDEDEAILILALRKIPHTKSRKLIKTVLESGLISIEKKAIIQNVILEKWGEAIYLIGRELPDDKAQVTAQKSA